MSDKLPFLPLYIGDWKKDAGVQALSRHDRMVWIELLMLMHECPRRGYLEIGDRPMTNKEICKLIDIHPVTWEKTLRKLRDNSVLSTCNLSGSLYCRRMVRDDEKRKKDKENGRLGGSPKLKGLTHPLTPPVNPPLKAISYSYSNSDKDIPENPDPAVNNGVHEQSGATAPEPPIPIPEENPKPKKRKKVVFTPDGKIKFRDWVYLTDEHLKQLQKIYEARGCDKDIFNLAVQILDAWYDDNPNIRASRADDFKVLQGWPLVEALKRRKTFTQARITT